MTIRIDSPNVGFEHIIANRDYNRINTRLIECDYTINVELSSDKLVLDFVCEVRDDINVMLCGHCQ